MAIVKNLSSKLYDIYEFSELNYRLSKSLELIDGSNQICMTFQKFMFMDITTFISLHICVCSHE